MSNRELQTDKKKLSENKIREIEVEDTDIVVNKWDDAGIWYETRWLNKKSQIRNWNIDMCSFWGIAVWILDDTTTLLVNADYVNKLRIWPYVRDKWLNGITIPSKWIYRIESEILRDWDNSWSRRLLLYKNWWVFWNNFNIRRMQTSDTTVYRMWLSCTVELDAWDLIWLAVRQNSWWVLSIIDWELTIRKP
jgi:hypothetical protein